MLTIYISDGGLKLSGSDVSVRVHAAKAACHGSLKLVCTREVPLAHHRHRRERTVIGHANYVLAAGRTRTVKIRLTATGLRLVRNAKRHRLQVTLSATVAGGMTTSKHAYIHEPVR